MSTSPAPDATGVMTVSVHHGMFCWFEHHSDSPERAVAFWTALVGGEHAAVPLPCGGTMHLMNAGPHHRWSLRPLAGCPAPLIERGPHWLPFVAVDDTDAAYARALSHGATGVTAPNDNGMGRGAVIVDPHGAAHVGTPTSRSTRWTPRPPRPRHSARRCRATSCRFRV